MLDEDLLRRLERLRLGLARYAAGRRQGDRPARGAGPSLEFRSHRAYAPGDDPRAIDWNAYARLGRLYVKEFLAQRVDRAEIRIDASRSMAAGGPPKWDVARRLAAALAAVGQSTYADLGVCAAERCRWTSREPLSRLVETLRDARAQDDRPPEALLGDLPPRRDSVVLVVSDLWPRDGDAAPLESALRGAAHRCALGVLHVLAPEEIDPPWQGPLRLRDAETGRERTLRVGEVERKAYRAELAQHVERVRRAVVEGGGSYVLLRAERSIEELVFIALREAGIVE